MINIIIVYNYIRWIWKAKAIANIKSKQGSIDKCVYDSKKQKTASIAFRTNLLERQLRGTLC